jgi:hypothetical protein
MNRLAPCPVLPWALHTKSCVSPGLARQILSGTHLMLQRELIPSNGSKPDCHQVYCTSSNRRLSL